MANYGTSTCFRLNWPKEACDTLKQAVSIISKEMDLNTPEFLTLGKETKPLVQHFTEEYETLGIAIVDHDDGGVLVMDEDGMFAPYMTADLLNAIMKDHDIEEVVSFTWSENFEKYRLNAFAGGGAVVSANEVRVFHVSDWVEKTAQEMREDLKENPPTP